MLICLSCLLLASSDKRAAPNREQCCGAKLLVCIGAIWRCSAWAHTGHCAKTRAAVSCMQFKCARLLKLRRTLRTFQTREGAPPCCQERRAEHAAKPIRPKAKQAEPPPHATADRHEEVLSQTPRTVELRGGISVIYMTEGKITTLLPNVNEVCIRISGTTAGISDQLRMDALHQAPPGMVDE